MYKVTTTRPTSEYSVCISVENKDAPPGTIFWINFGVVFCGGWLKWFFLGDFFFFWIYIVVSVVKNGRRRSVVWWCLWIMRNYWKVSGNLGMVSCCMSSMSTFFFYFLSRWWTSIIVIWCSCVLVYVKKSTRANVILFNNRNVVHPTPQINVLKVCCLFLNHAACFN